MLQNQKNQTKQLIIDHPNFLRVVFGCLLIIFSSYGFVKFAPLPQAQADIYDEQIEALKNENTTYQLKVGELQARAGTLKEELARLDQQKQEILAQIKSSEQRIAELKHNIATKEQEIDRGRKVLNEVLTELYVEQSISPVERLASGVNLAEYIDKETNLRTIQSSLSDKVKDIKKQKADLEKTQKDVERTLERQKGQKSDLEASEADRSRILEETKGEEGRYSELASKNNSRIEELRAEQARQMSASLAGSGTVPPPGSAGGGGYPDVWAYAPLDAYVDTWGLYTRECVSYAAWKVHSTGRFVPHFGGRGNANQWPSTTAAHGIPNGYEPRAGSVAVWYIGYYGHVMYVEAVHGDGTITVSDYNLGWDGLYRIYRRSAAGLTYIYF